MSELTKQSVSLAIFDAAGEVLIVRRPGDDEDLPNAWGLPASSLRAGESWEAAILRTGREKLGVELASARELRRGTRSRRAYTLEMRLYEARIVAGEPVVPQSVAGVTQYQEWRWGEAEALKPAASAGSLCCSLYLDFVST